jgi:hypothetical protein
VSVPQAFAGTLQSPAPILHVTPRLFSSLVTVAFRVTAPEAAAMLVIGFVIATEMGPVTVMLNVAVTVVPLPVALTVAVTEQPPEGMLAAGGGVYVVVAAFVGLREPSAEDEQAGGVVASGCTSGCARRTDDALATAA